MSEIGPPAKKLAHPRFLVFKKTGKLSFPDEQLLFVESRFVFYTLFLTQNPVFVCLKTHETLPKTVFGCTSQTRLGFVINVKAHVIKVGLLNLSI